MAIKQNYPRLYCAQKLSLEADIALSAEEINYLKNALRLKNGQLIKVFNQKCGEFFAAFMCEKKICYLTVKKFIRPAFACTYLHVAPSLIKPPLMAEVINSAVQLGATHITPLISQRVNYHSFNIERGQKIAKEALEQSGRSDFVYLNPALSLQEFISQNVGLMIFADESQNSTTLLDIAKNDSLPSKITIIIGPEGGFSKEEIELLNTKATSITLGKNILRAETACICLLSQIMLLRK